MLQPFQPPGGRTRIPVRVSDRVVARFNLTGPPGYITVRNKLLLPKLFLSQYHNIEKARRR